MAEQDFEGNAGELGEIAHRHLEQNSKKLAAPFPVHVQLGLVTDKYLTDQFLNKGSGKD
jgi:hypothetical protein